MKPLREKLQAPRVRLWVRTVLVFLLGLACLFLYDLENIGDTWRHVLRDLGIALLIGALVTFIYERYARERAAAETIEQVLERVIGDLIDTQTWREIREQILEKRAIRKGTQIRLRLSLLEGSTSPHVCKLWMETTYELSSLRSHEHDHDIVHFLDAYMNNLQRGTPRFVRVDLDGAQQTIPPNESMIKLRVKLAGRDAKPLQVRIIREELVYYPGAYTFIMSELTALEYVTLEDVPPDMRVIVNCMFHEQELTASKPLRWSRYLLPGQCLEMRFMPCGDGTRGSS